MKFATGQHGFQHVACIHGAVSFSCAYDQVKLIDEEDDLTFALLDFFEDGFQSFLKFTSVFGAGHQSTHIQGKDGLVFQGIRNIAPDDTLSQTFYGCGFTNTGFTDEDRIVFRLTGKDTDHITDLRITADDRIQFLVSGFLHQILAVFVQGIISYLRVVAGHALIAADC